MVAGFVGIYNSIKIDGDRLMSLFVWIFWHLYLPVSSTPHILYLVMLLICLVEETWNQKTNTNNHHPALFLQAHHAVPELMMVVTNDYPKEILNPACLKTNNKNYNIL